MSGDPITFDERGCPVCHKDIMSFESEDGGFADGEPCFCAGDCGWNGHIAVSEDGAAWAAPTDEVESLVHIIEEQRQRLIRARDHMLLIFPDGIKSQHDQARQVFMALENTDGQASNSVIGGSPHIT